MGHKTNAPLIAHPVNSRGSWRQFQLADSIIFSGRSTKPYNPSDPEHLSGRETAIETLPGAD